MQLKYVDTKEEIIAINRKSKHIEPHLHNALEIVCVTSGALELGVGQELYHMEKGDIGFVFPDVIHQYQVLTPGVNKATYLIASPFTIGKFADIMQSMAPEYPVIKAEKVEPEVYRVINAILETEQSDITIAQAYLQIVLARCIGKLNLVEKSSVGSNDLIYQTVSYISANFKKKFSLEEMAKDLGVSKYVLSRLFSRHSIDYSGTLRATCPDFESHHSGEWEPYIPVIQSHLIGLYYIYFLYTVNTHLWCEYR